jgi:uncharacterized protein YbjT (DUF2867 family)
MILVTGGTGFIGRALVRHLTELDYPVRILLRPSRETPKLPLGVAVEVAVSGLTDERSLRGAMKGVDVVFHLASAERSGIHGDLNQTDVEGTQTVAAAAKSAGVERIFYLSHLKADKSSAYPVMKAKALAEQAIINSGVPYNIFRSSIIFGPGDQFTCPLTRLNRISPGIVFVPGDGSVILQPLWIEDLMTCITICLEDPDTINKTYLVGGMEYLTFKEIMATLMTTVGHKKPIVSIPSSYLRLLALFIDQLKGTIPISLYWLDYLANDQTCPVDSVPRMFGLMPARFSQHLEYLPDVYREPVRKKRK